MRTEQSKGGTAMDYKPKSALRLRPPDPATMLASYPRLPTPIHTLTSKEAFRGGEEERPPHRSAHAAPDPPLRRRAGRDPSSARLSARRGRVPSPVRARQGAVARAGLRGGGA